MDLLLKGRKIEDRSRKVDDGEWKVENENDYEQRTLIRTYGL